MIDKLTPEQEAKMPDYVKEYKAIGLCTDPCDFDKSVEAAKLSYEKASQKQPKFFLGPFNNPIEAAYAQSILPKYHDDCTAGKYTSEQINKIIMAEVTKHFAKKNPEIKGLSVKDQVFGYNDASWLAFYAFFKRECGLKECEKLDGLDMMARVCGWWTPLEDYVLFQHRALEIHFDDRNRLNNPDGAAVKYRGSHFCDIYSVHGVTVTKKIIDRDYTHKDVDKESNAEVRRVMIDLYPGGQAQYLIDSNAKEVATDEFGTLYSKAVPDDEAIVMVKVVNSTAEPDGTFKDYWIRIDPNAYNGQAAKIPQAAVASTWRNTDGSMVFKDWKDYTPAVET